MQKFSVKLEKVAPNRRANHRLNGILSVLIELPTRLNERHFTLADYVDFACDILQAFT